MRQTEQFIKNFVVLFCSSHNVLSNFLHILVMFCFINFASIARISRELCDLDLMSQSPRRDQIPANTDFLILPAFCGYERTFISVEIPTLPRRLKQGASWFWLPHSSVANVTLALYFDIDTCLDYWSFLDLSGTWIIFMSILHARYDTAHVSKVGRVFRHIFSEYNQQPAQHIRQQQKCCVFRHSHRHSHPHTSCVCVCIM